MRSMNSRTPSEMAALTFTVLTCSHAREACTYDVRHHNYQSQIMYDHFEEGHAHVNIANTH